MLHTNCNGHMSTCKRASERASWTRLLTWKAQTEMVSCVVATPTGSGGSVHVTAVSLRELITHGFHSANRNANNR